MHRVYFEEFCRRVTEDAPYAVFHRENVNYVAHIHEEIEVGFVVSGSVRASGESCDYLLNEGDIYVFLPDEIHALTSESPNLLYILRLLPKQSDRVDFSSFRSSSNYLFHYSTFTITFPLRFVKLILQNHFSILTPATTLQKLSVSQCCKP